jgi:hypothetical protein
MGEPQRTWVLTCFKCNLPFVDVVEGEFRACGWEWQMPRIGVESTERVKRGGGFDYFR